MPKGKRQGAGAGRSEFGGRGIWGHNVLKKPLLRWTQLRFSG